MKKILVLNGPNLNILGIREKGMYGVKTYGDLLDYIDACAEELKLDVEVMQSNHEGDLVDYIQSAYGMFDGIVINPAAYTHTSVAILDALKGVNIPTVEVHLTDINNREEFRKLSYVSLFAEKQIIGKGFEGYKEALEYFTK